MNRGITIACLLAAVVPGLALAAGAQAQPLACTISTTALSGCTGSPLNGLQHMQQCYSGTLTGCAGARDITFYFGYLNPTGTPKGTIVLLPGSGGMNANNYQEGSLAQDYASSGFQAVQLQWAAQWEDVNQGNSSSTNCSSTPCTPNILAASARPASFLAYIYNNFLLPIRNSSPPNPTAGMCVEGFSAGSAAAAYTLADWGGDKYLDKVELLSGPTLNDIQGGCLPQNTPVVVPICSGTPTPSFCQLGSGTYSQASWSVAPNYVEPNLNSVQIWTDTTTCTCGGLNNGISGVDCNAGNAASGGNPSNYGWAKMSVLNSTSITNYPNTVVTGFICATTTDETLNNSAPLGWTFFDNPITAKNLNLYAVQNCQNSEGVFAPSSTNPPVQGAWVPAILTGTPPTPEAGKIAVENDMASSGSLTGVCQNNH